MKNESQEKRNGKKMENWRGRKEKPESTQLIDCRNRTGNKTQQRTV